MLCSVMWYATLTRDSTRERYRGGNCAVHVPRRAGRGFRRVRCCFWRPNTAVARLQVPRTPADRDVGADKVANDHLQISARERCTAGAEAGLNLARHTVNNPPASPQRCNLASYTPHVTSQYFVCAPRGVPVSTTRPVVQGGHENHTDSSRQTPSHPFHKRRRRGTASTYCSLNMCSCR